MKDAIAGKTTVRVEGKPEGRSNLVRIVVPYLILGASQLPLCFVYFRNIWDTRDHFKFAPFAFLAVGAFLYVRWPRSEAVPFFGSTKSNFLLVVGMVCGVLGTLLVSPWLAYASVVFFVTSFLERTSDEKAPGRLTSLVAPLAVLLIPPFGFDFENVQGDLTIISAGNTIASSVSSDLMDLVGLIHNQTGTRVVLPNVFFDTMAIGNGVFSVYTLLILTGIFIALQRRPLLHGVLLLVSAWGWWFIFQAIAILVFALGYSAFSLDWYNGETNVVIQIFCLFFAGLLIFATDQFLVFLLGPVDITAIDESATYQYGLTILWNRYIAGSREASVDRNDEKQVAREKRRNRPPSKKTSTLLWASAVVMTLFALIQLIDIGRTLAKTDNSILSNPGNNDLVVDPDLLPDGLGGWIQSGFVSAPPDFESPFTGHRETWTYRNDQHGFEIEVSLRHAFPGWHNPILEFESNDWKIADQEIIINRQASNDRPDWPIVSVVFENNITQSCFLLFSEIDGFGDSFEVPHFWNQHMLSRSVSRLSNRNRPRLFETHSIVISVSAAKYGALTQKEKLEVKQLFLQARDALRASILDGSLFVSANRSATILQP